MVCKKLSLALFSLLMITASAMGDSVPAEQKNKLPFLVPEKIELLPRSALIETSKGPIEIVFFRQEAPISAANFEHLGRKGVYEGVEFHRYVPGFIIQGGDPTGTTKGDPGWSLPPEIHPNVRHLRGAVGWAQLPWQNNPERLSNGSQFYIALSANPGLDGFYTVFAQVVRGMENVEKLRVGDKILKVRFPKQEKDGERSPSAEPWN